MRNLYISAYLVSNSGDNGDLGKNFANRPFLLNIVMILNDFFFTVNERTMQDLRHRGGGTLLDPPSHSKFNRKSNLYLEASLESDLSWVADRNMINSFPAPPVGPSTFRCASTKPPPLMSVIVQLSKEIYSGCDIWIARGSAATSYQSNHSSITETTISDLSTSSTPAKASADFSIPTGFPAATSEEDELRRQLHCVVRSLSRREPLEPT